MPKRSTGSRTEREVPLVPAVSRAVRLLSVLVDMPEGATLTEFARKAQLSPSSTSNLLHTMADEGLLSFDSVNRRYNLGPRLVMFGAAAVGRNAPLMQAFAHMNDIVDETGLACLGIQRMPDGEFIAVEKVESRRKLKVTIEVGERFPSDAPALSRLWGAWTGLGETVHHRYTAKTLTNQRDIEKSLSAIRARGYAAVYGEYIPNLNVVGVPVFARDQLPCLALMVLGMGDDLAPAQVKAIAPKLITAARRITLSSGGRLPDDYPEAP